MSLICSDYDCPACKEEEHEECLILGIKGIITQLNSQVELRKNTIRKVLELEGSFSEELKKTSYPLAEGSRFGGLEEKERKIALEIFEKGNSTFLRGAEAAAFYKKVKEVPKLPNE